MVTFRFISITHEPNPVDHAPFDFLVTIDSNGSKTLLLTFTLQSSLHVFIVNGARQSSFSTTRPVPDGTSTQHVPARIDGPTGNVPVSVLGTNTADPQDSVPSGTVVHV
jgi:hypothetical protein